MNLLFFIIIAIVLIMVFFIAWAVSKYNILTHLSALIDEGWSGIDVQLKRRYDLIPNLVSVAKMYATHEKDIFERVAQARAQSMGATNIQEKAVLENNLTQALKTIFALAENYPTLKANENFLALQKDLGHIEHDLQLARRYYNGTVRTYNTAIAQFPSNIVANTYSFSARPYFDIGSPEQRENPIIKA